MRRHSYYWIPGLLVVSGLLLAACTQSATPTPLPLPEVTATTDATPDESLPEAPTPTPDEPPLPANVVDLPIPGASSDLQSTWDAYLADSLAFQVARMQDRLLFLGRYQNPTHLNQNMSGLMANIDLLEDRTTFVLSNGRTFASATADFDIRITFADGDTERRTCMFLVQMEVDPGNGLWYVINPVLLDPSSLCRE